MPDKNTPMRDLVSKKKDNHLPKEKVYMGNSYTKNEQGIILPHAQKGGTLLDSDGKVLNSKTSNKEVQSKLMAQYEAEMAKQNEMYDKLQQEVEDYNASVPILDPRYSEEIELINMDMIVRLYQLPYIGENGMVVRNQIEEPNKSGHGHGKMVDDPYPYNMVGVVINYDPRITDQSGQPVFEKGDIVQVSPAVARTEYLQHFQTFVMPKAFSRVEDLGQDKAFQGYILISPREVLCKINNYKPHGTQKDEESRSSKSSRNSAKGSKK